MSRPIKVLKDNAARRDAISLYNQSILVEAGAGSGKTAVMAGRIALMLAEGVAPRTIAAVTFTELAASELLSRVRDFVVDLAADRIPPELAVALPDGLSLLQKDNLAKASAVLDEITCTTIHGFCQCLIKPYPAEANIDPGASVTDRNQADLIFQEITDAWLRERLSGDEDGVLGEMVLYSPKKTIALVQKIAEHLRRQPTLCPPSASPIDRRIESFCQSTTAFAAFIQSARALEPETAVIVELFQGMADALAKAPDPGTPSGLVQILISQAHPDLCTKEGPFRAYTKKKTKWTEAAKQTGLSKADGERLNVAAQDHYQNCCDAWNALKASAASLVLAALIAEARSILDRYRDHKRAAALLDFDDLIFAARDLLRHHEDVRRALGQRFLHVLVDEFQDTDPLQTEIFWRLCGEPPAEAPQAHWTEFHIRSGALFLVGDPKQAIYRFRGADVSTYVLARETLRAQHADSLLSISTNLRSSASILSYVNQRFEAVLSSDGQPGFTALDAFHEDHAGALCVAALDVAVENGSTISELKRDAEAEGVAELCARLIGSHNILDRRTGNKRPCRPGDIALLAPTGTDLWRYEEALERRGIPVATQAGKGLFRRQEIQDLIALTRVLADRRDTLALGALLRGPLVGLSEEEILDIVWSLPRSDDKPDRLPCLDLNVDLSTVGHPLARDVLERLQTLQRRSNSTTPYDLLSQAVDMLRVRPILLERHLGHAERALANVDLYLSLSRTYAVRGRAPSPRR
jgi:ATP-dependent exoDNAse (exonuclease V) beta subunit